MSGHPEHVGQDYLSELPKLIVTKIRITAKQSSVGHLQEFQNQINGIPNLTDHGTGSYPPFENGLQRRIRQAASRPPLKTPYFSIAWIA
jgi:hypothetical protein